MMEENENPVGEEHVKSRPRKKFLYKQILQQMEFYFGDVNLGKDRFLSQLVISDKYVPLDVFLRFNKIKALTSDMVDLANALRRSQMLKVTDDGLYVYRCTPINKKENEDDCTIYVEQLPPDANHDWVKNVFSVYGNVDYVSIPKYKHKQAIKGFAFVEFSVPEEAQKALEAFGSVGCCLPSQMLPEELYSISTFVEDGNVLSRGFTQGGSEKQNVADNTNWESGPTVHEEKAKEMDNTAEKQKKKKKKKHGEEVEGEECVQLEEEQKEKRKRKRDEQVSPLAEEEEQGEEISVEEGISHKKKKKKKRMEEVDCETRNKIKDAENRDDDEERVSRKKKKKLADDEEKKDGSDEGDAVEEEMEVLDDNNDEQETNEKTKKNKRNRNHKCKKEKKEAPTSLGLRIMSKVEWKRLRAKYLNLQREKMGAVKKRLKRSNWGSNYHSPAAGEQVGAGEQEAKERNPKEPLTFTPGVILKVQLPEPVADLKKFKNEVKAHNDILYVDVQDQSEEMYLRCSSAPATQKLLAEGPWERMELLEGEEEKQYWDKILASRKEKRLKRNCNENVKQRGRDKLLKRAESELGKHIKFDDGDE